MKNWRFASLVLVLAGTTVAFYDAVSSGTHPELGLRSLNSRAQKAITIPIGNEGSGYSAKIAVGTPPQNLQLTLSGTSGDIWVNANSTYCSSANPSPCSGGLYDANKSSTYQFINGNLAEYFSDGSLYLSGDWVKDDLILGTTPVDALRIALAYNTTYSPGVLGLGYGALESTTLQYVNLPARLKRLGLTNVNAHSIWPNQISADGGELTFGGVDTNKFYGTLETIPVTEDAGARIKLDKMQIGYNGKKTTLYDSPISVVLDVGEGSMTLPPEITTPLFASFGVSCDPLCYVDPLQLRNTSTLDFVFGSKTISVTMDELVVAYNSTSSRWATDVGDYVSDASIYTLGNVFLRNAYAVFDWDNQEISLAQSNFASTSRNIIALPAGGVRSASLKGVPSSADTSGTPATSAASFTSSGTHAPTGTSTSTGTSSASSSSSSLSSGAKAGIGAGVAIGALLLLAAVVYFIYGRRRHRNRHTVRSSASTRDRKGYYDEPELVPMNHFKPEGVPMKYSEDARQELHSDAREHQRHEMDNVPMVANMHGGPLELEDHNTRRYELDAAGRGVGRT